MSEINMKDIILKIFDEINILTDEDGMLVSIDSLSYIQLIVALEDSFNIIFPDELLVISTLKNVDDFVVVVGNLIDMNPIEKREIVYENS